jgi:hypothetical protein
LRLRTGHRRAAVAAGIAVVGLFAAGVVSAHTVSAAVPGSCAVDVLGSCAATAADSGSSPTPAPLVSVSSSSLCILVVCTSGTQSNPTPTPTPCLLNSCLPVTPPPTCNITADPTCLVSPTPGGCQAGCPTQTQNPATPPPGTSTPGRNRGGQASASASGGAAGGGLGGSSGLPSPSSGVPLGLNLATVPVVQSLSPVSGLELGHAPILWPLFGALDILGLAVAFVVIRRSRAARLD